MMPKQPQWDSRQIGHEATVVTDRPQSPILTLATVSLTPADCIGLCTVALRLYLVEGLHNVI